MTAAPKVLGQMSAFVTFVSLYFRLPASMLANKTKDVLMVTRQAVSTPYRPRRSRTVASQVGIGDCS